MTQETSHATNARILAETHFEISEFLKLFSPLLERHLIGEGRQRSFSRLALCEIMTILVAHQIIGAPNLKHFYQKIIWQYHRREFPGLISYSRFIGIAAIAVVPLTLYLRFRMEMSRHTGLYVIDSTPLRVCMNLGNSRLIVHPLQLAGEMRTKYLGSDSSRCNRWLISWKAFFATLTPFP